MTRTARTRLDRRRWIACVATAIAFTPAASFAAPSAQPADLRGPWKIVQPQSSLQSADGRPPPLKPAARALYDQRVTAKKAGDKSVDPLERCLPPGVPRLLLQPYPFSIVQGKTLYGFIFEWNHLPRIVYLNQDHFESIGPQYLGQSIGHWEGAVLIVDTIDYNDTTFLDDAGLPHSEALHTTERLQLQDGGNILEDRIHIDDPVTFSAPWDAVLKFKKQPADTLIHEDYCLGRTGQGRLQGK